MKKIIGIILIIAVCVTCFSGCSNQIIEIKDRALVQAIGIDKKNNSYIVSLQVFQVTEGSGGNGVDTSNSNVMTLISEGTTINDAIKNSQVKNGKNIFLGQAKIIILGKSVQSENIEELLSYFLNNSIINPSIEIVCTENNASDVIDTKITQSIVSAEHLLKIIKISAYDGYTREVVMKDFISDMQSINKSAVLPVVSVSKTENTAEENNMAEEKHEKEVAFNQLNVVKNSRVVGKLNETQIRGLKWILNDIKKINMTIPFKDNGIASVNMEYAKTLLDVEIKDGYPVIKVGIIIRGEIVECIYNKKENDFAQIKEEIRKNMDQQIISECMSAVNIAKDDLGVDIFNIEKLLKQRESKYYMANKDRWDDVLENTTFEYKILSGLERGGVEVDN